MEVLRDPARVKVVVCGRRWGKTTAGLLATVEGHGPRQGGFKGALEGATIWWVAPSFPIASLIWRNLKRALRGAWVEKNENERRIVLPGDGSVTVKSADNPDALRGTGLDGVVLDEAAFMMQAAWSEGIRPALADRQGWACFLTTPRGTNWLYDLFQAAATTPGWARWQRPTSDNPRVPATELDAARGELGSYAFSQEFEAQFLTPGGGFFKTEWFDHRYDATSDGGFGVGGTATVASSALRRFGTVDLAASLRTTADYSVVLSAGVAPDGRLLVLDVDRARREGPDLVPAMKRAVDRWQLGTIWVEKVGFQLSLIQDARRQGLPVRELVPDRDKVARALPATAAFEGGRILLPRHATWLRDFEAELLAFPNGQHDDQVDCLSYAVAAAKQGWASSPLLADPGPLPESYRVRERLFGECRPAAPWGTDQIGCASPW